MQESPGSNEGKPLRGRPAETDVTLPIVWLHYFAFDMRIIDAQELVLDVVNHCGERKYAILSHRWGDEEVNLEDFTANSTAVREKLGYAKIQDSCTRAVQDGYSYVWVDTCCIDKTSSSELSEAINSMYLWYQQAEVCYAYLFDVDVPDGYDPDLDDGKALEKSAWFERGWTLQELVAPRNMIFFSKDWKVLGTKAGLKQILARITKIDEDILDGSKDLSYISVAKRMSWAATRETSRPEDMAYCLMGIFNVNMPMLYGEGGEKAFVRLQEQIMQDSDDESMFAWRCARKEGDDRHEDDALHGLLATSSQCFADSDHFIPYCDWERRPPFSKTNKGLQISLHLTPYEGEVYIAALNCPAPVLNYSGFLAIFLKRISANDRGNAPGEDYQHYARIRADELPSLDRRGALTALYVRQNPTTGPNTSIYPEHILQLRRGSGISNGYRLVKTLGHQSSAALMLSDREWIPSAIRSAFSLAKGVARIAAVLVFQRVHDGSEFAVLLGSTADFGIGIDVREKWNNEDFNSIEQDGVVLGFKPGEEVETEREMVRVLLKEIVASGKKYYVANVEVKTNPKWTALNGVVETVGRAGGLGFHHRLPVRIEDREDVEAVGRRSNTPWYRKLKVLP